MGSKRWEARAGEVSSDGSRSIICSSGLQSLFPDGYRYRRHGCVMILSPDDPTAAGSSESILESVLMRGHALIFRPFYGHRCFLNNLICPTTNVQLRRSNYDGPSYDDPFVEILSL